MRQIITKGRPLDVQTSVKAKIPNQLTISGRHFTKQWEQCHCFSQKACTSLLCSIAYFYFSLLRGLWSSQYWDDCTPLPPMYDAYMIFKNKTTLLENFLTIQKNFQQRRTSFLGSNIQVSEPSRESKGANCSWAKFPLDHRIQGQGPHKVPQMCT